jgi:hypothetical protein
MIDCEATRTESEDDYVNYFDEIPINEEIRLFVINIRDATNLDHLITRLLTIQEALGEEYLNNDET